MNKDETIEALTQEIWDELPPGRHWTEMGPAQEKTVVRAALRKSATLATLLTGTSLPTAYNSSPTGKVLTGGELERILCNHVDAKDAEDALRVHITALEHERAETLAAHADRQMERDTLSVRDEFAKAAMQAFAADMWRSATEATMREFATRAYRMADAMLSARSNAVDITPEQETEWGIEERSDAARQTRATIRAAVARVCEVEGMGEHMTQHFIDAVDGAAP